MVTKAKTKTRKQKSSATSTAPPTVEQTAGEAPCPIQAAIDRQRAEHEQAEIAELAGLERDLAASIYRDSFADFVARFWSVVTGGEYRQNKITTAIIAALQRVGNGEVSKLILNCPPGCGKSTLLALWSAWRIARDPSWKALTASHAYELAATTSRRVRRLVASPEFQAMFPVKLREDEAQIALWATDEGGHFIAVGRDSGVTGRRVSEIICDDLGAAADRYSKAALDHAWTFFAETLSTRLDNDRAAQIVCGQRIAVDDVSGRLIAMGGWTVISIPAETDDGEPLAPDVLPRDKLDGVRAQIGAAAYACQYLERPSSDDNAIVKRAWWRFHRPRHVPSSSPRPAGCDLEQPAVITPERFDRVVISVDMSFGSLKGDYAVAQVWGAVGGDRYLLEQFRKKCSQLEQQGAIKALAAKYSAYSPRILVERAAGGAGAIEQLTSDGITNIVPVLPGGKGKRERLGLVSPAIEGGHVYLPLGASWLGDFVEELSEATSHDDMMDATAYALANLTGRSDADDLQMRIDGFRRAAGMSGGWHLPGLVDGLGLPVTQQHGLGPIETRGTRPIVTPAEDAMSAARALAETQFVAAQAAAEQQYQSALQSVQQPQGFDPVAAIMSGLGRQR